MFFKSVRNTIHTMRASNNKIHADFSYGSIQDLFPSWKYKLLFSCWKSYWIRSHREMAARESLASQGRRREHGRQPPGVLHISRDP